MLIVTPRVVVPKLPVLVMACACPCGCRAEMVLVCGLCQAGLHEGSR